MTRLMIRPSLLLFVFLLAISFRTVRAENAGDEDLDLATVTKLRAKTDEDLQKTIDLCKSAIKKGLDDDGTVFAKELLSSTYFERATVLSNAILERRPPAAQWMQIRSRCLSELEEALKYDEEFGEVHLLIARLQALPRGDAAKARAAADKAIELIAEKIPQSEAYVVKGSLEEDRKLRLEAFTKAIELNPENSNALRGRAIVHLENGDVEKANEDFNRILVENPNDLTANQAIAEILVREKKFDDALKYLDKALESEVKVIGVYLMKAEILEATGKKQDAVKTLDEAVKQFPRIAPVWLTLARMRIELNDLDLAAKDLEEALKLSPNDNQALLLRSVLLASKREFGPAVRDIKRVIRVLSKTPNAQSQANNLRLQLSNYYVNDQNPSKAVAVLSEVLENDPQNGDAYRSRGDAFLAMGRHRDAISDYESSLEINKDDSGALNNLAWVLSTSPKDEVRDPMRAIELATKACELTEFKAAHIISTLAASYAENSNFDEAIKWSTKAVDLNKDEEQLANELESYKAGKPWRELQEVKEKPDEEPAEVDLELGLEPDIDDLP